MSAKLKIFDKFDAELEKLWTSLEVKDDNPFLNYEINKTWFNIFGENSNLKIFSDNKNFIAPMYFQKNVAYFCGGQDLFDYHDLISNQKVNKESIKQLFNEILENVNLIELKSIVSGSKLHKFASEIEKEYEVNYINEDVCPIISLPDTFENYLLQLSKKNRHEIRRKIRKFENNLEFEIIETDESNVDEHLLEFLRLMKLNPEKRNFLNQSRIEFMSKIIKYAILSNIGNLTFIKIENEMVATSFEFKNNDKLFVYNSGYNDNYSEYSVGLLNHIYNIKNKISEYKFIDFLRGPEEYKYRIGCINQDLITIKIKRKS
ncbi:MAG: GNAT family N-acetyltransferase [Chloroflexota bacterium]|nr:GNAT family N-acetyltransferase [Chloroflexota bacterium]